MECFLDETTYRVGVEKTQLTSVSVEVIFENALAHETSATQLTAMLERAL